MGTRVEVGGARPGLQGAEEGARLGLKQGAGWEELASLPAGSQHLALHVISVQ